MMQDAASFWGGDLTAGPTGDVGLASGAALGQQRVLRRLLTNPGESIWDARYGAGLAAMVGGVVDIPAIHAVIRSQIFKEATVAKLPDPTIDVSQQGDGSVFVEIRYVDASSQATQLLAFSMMA